MQYWLDCSADSIFKRDLPYHKMIDMPYAAGEIIASGDKRSHDQALKALRWQGGGSYDQASENKDVTYKS